MQSSLLEGYYEWQKTEDGKKIPELWLTGITEHPTAEGKLYLCAVKDVYSGRIVGYSMDARMKSSLAVGALENAVRARRPAGAVVHSDSETVRTGIPGGSLTRIVMDATG